MPEPSTAAMSVQRWAGFKTRLSYGRMERDARSPTSTARAKSSWPRWGGARRRRSTYLRTGDIYAIGGLAVHCNWVLKHYRRVLDRLAPRPPQSSGPTTPPPRSRRPTGGRSPGLTPASAVAELAELDALHQGVKQAAREAARGRLGDEDAGLLRRRRRRLPDQPRRRHRLAARPLPGARPPCGRADGRVARRAVPSDAKPSRAPNRSRLRPPAPRSTLRPRPRRRASDGAAARARAAAVVVAAGAPPSTGWWSASPDNFTRTREHGFSIQGIKSRHKNRVASMHAGDRILYYVHRPDGLRRDRHRRPRRCTRTTPRSGAPTAARRTTRGASTSASTSCSRSRSGCSPSTSPTASSTSRNGRPSTGRWPSRAISTSCPGPTSALLEDEILRLVRRLRAKDPVAG